MYGYKLVMVKEEGKKYPDQPARDPATVAKMLAEYVGTIDREAMVVLALNTRNYVCGINTVSIGSLDCSIVHPREVFKFAILSNASSIILCHNHPSGNPEPSQDDIKLTKRLVQAGELLGIDVTDHIILGLDGRYLSMKREGLL